MKYLNKTALLRHTALAALLFSATANVWAAAVDELQQRLAEVGSYSADFNQRVTSADGKLVQEGSGKFQVKRPNLFRLDSKKPQETQIIADGKTLWYYDPFVQQVTARKVSEAIDNTPFILLTSNDPKQWNNYTVTQKDDTFTLTPKAKDSAIKRFEVRIDNNGLLRNFSTVEQDGQANLYMLRNMNNVTLDNKLFQFSVPKGVELDDQR
ncbi:outer membrane lipoprotein chaperone LolA [Testudinibacter aquarius]|uniref:Outer-membrane lipoprotein carrier protein n=1 Tax=Testudinibacter aquarius TaxID=1524974 RepID=A0A4V2W1X9_9PAST|nr:outer membrane lipoprotein chaperone LolA [Testudinibacter aquarius]KAE9530344.1 outer-membrane lipoprotein carrier protein LolA [Testudinibacter aquarius]TCV85939.1 outer membrane lipoprotein carrier protein [Testudinibacter aquarius]TNG86493.1 outer membrane lipoprotein chaperone LolA [Testudinibacter aquarius]